jgi:hydroxymethylglutaryl-CoA synthase
MAAIVGYGAYIPRYRIKTEEIHRAWKRSGGRGEKAVAASDEDALTMGVKAAQAALASAAIAGGELGAVYFASVSSGYAENTLVAQLAQVLGAKPEVTVADYGLSTRSVTAALQACVDAIESGRVSYGLVVGSDLLLTHSGSDYELSYAAGAGAFVVAQEGLAQLEGCAGCTSGFVGRSRREGRTHATTVDERFVMQHGFIEHTTRAAQDLVKVMGVTFEQFDLVVLQAPDSRWATRALANLGLDAKKLVSTFAHMGYAGCASLLIDLAYALEKSNAGQRILVISYGPGGSDALAWKVVRSPSQQGDLRTVEEQLQQKEYLSYAEYLLCYGMRGLLR